MLDAKNSLANPNANPNADPISLILNKDGRTAAEVASLGTLDDADRAAEKQFSCEAPTIASLFGNAKAIEEFITSSLVND